MLSARQGLAAPALLMLAAIGCRNEPPLDLPSWQSSRPQYLAEAGTSNAFGDYVAATHEVERLVKPEYLNRTNFTPGKRDAAVKQLSRPIARVAAGSRKNCKFNYQPNAPFQPVPYHQGWRLIGRGLVWRIEEACAVGNYDAAIRDCIVATKFGFDLTGGAVMDASLGLATADEARKALAPHLRSMGAGQLRTLSRGIKRAVEAKPSIVRTLQNEESSMLLAVETVQNAFLNGKLDPLRDELGSGVREAVDYLEQMREQSAAVKLAYFRGFAAEAKEQAQWLISMSGKPLAQRRVAEGPELQAERPWKRFAKHFFTAGEPLLKMEDVTRARTRLMILECEILSQVKTTGAAPRDLGKFSRDISTDPYSGKAFVYRASGPEFSLYSVGADIRDDGGQTDESYLVKDLTLERPRA